MVNIGKLKGGWCFKEVRDRYEIGLWKVISKLWETVNSRVSFFVGNKRRVKFWKDKWCGNEPLCVSFLSYLP